MVKVVVKAEPHDFSFDPSSAVFMIIDMQNDFIKPGGMADLKGFASWV